MRLNFRLNNGVTAGANIISISMSLGGGSPSTVENNAFQSAYDSGVLLIAAAGNSGSSSGNDIRNAMNASSEDLGFTGRDQSYGFGLALAKSTYDYLITNSCGGVEPIIN